MKKVIYVLLLLVFTNLFSQVNTELIDVKKASQDSITNIDSFNFKYYLNGNRLKKENTLTTFDYSNLKLGNIANIDAFNPLKTFILYKDTNSVVILDNRFAEIKIIDFNQLKSFKVISHISNANNNNFWIFNTIDNRLELFNYNSLSTKIKTNPIISNILDITSDYNYVWLLTEESILCYNYAGSLIYKLKNDHYQSIKNINENLVLKKGDSIYFYNKTTKETDLVSLTNQLINSFFVSQQNLYIYEQNKLYTYQLNY
ncbi:hypothetical protein [Aurantibacter sp.]|uniref:hypothetical protein n=1 Tax=Aurantibacter sp. TaxID=2807103 RepID=UPI0035C872BF